MQVNWTKGMPLWLKSVSIITGILVSLSDYSIPLLAQSSQITSNTPSQAEPILISVAPVLLAKQARLTHQRMGNEDN